jgi:hypothetical protein
MTLPFASNTTCDIYRSGRLPPSAPDVAAVKCVLVANFFSGLEHGESDTAVYRYSHWMFVDLATDVRDDYGFGGHSSNPDTVCVPDKNGTQFIVIFVERKRTGTDYLKVYLQRKAIASYPAQVQ